MPIEILMPALSPTMEKGNLAKWLKKEGDKVAPGDVIAEIETDKATMEVEAIDEGTLAKILVPEGTAYVPVNQLIAVPATDGEDAKAVAAGGASAPKAAPAPAAEAPKVAEPAPAVAPAPVAAAPVAAAPAAAPAAAGARVFASPLARPPAQAQGRAPSSVHGPGPPGRLFAPHLAPATPRPPPPCWRSRRPWCPSSRRAGRPRASGSSPATG